MRGFLFPCCIVIIASLNGCIGQLLYDKFCPRKCSCEQRIAVHCSGVGLLNIPRKLPRGTLQLLAEENNITELPVYMLRNGKSLHTLLLNGNKIERISPENFRNTPQLEYLDLSQNNITLVPDDAFFGLLKLQMLILSDNKIMRLSPKAFNDLPSLRELFLSNNKIRALPTTIFLQFGNLHTLTLDGNQITTIPDGLLRGLTSLKTLDLSGNRIHRISPRTTEGLCSLEELYLRNNEIEDFDEHLQVQIRSCEDGVGMASSETIRHSNTDGVFTTMKVLKTLDLRENSLHTLHYSSFLSLSKLQTLKLDENIWRCTCNLKWTIMALRHHLRNGRLAWEEIYCSEPNIIRNINLDDLSMQELDSLLPSLTRPSTTTESTKDWYYYLNDEENNFQILNTDDVWLTTHMPETKEQESVIMYGSLTDIPPLHDPYSEKSELVTESTSNTYKPTEWSLSRAIGGDSTLSTTSDTMPYESNDVFAPTTKGSSRIRNIVVQTRPRQPVTNFADTGINSVREENDNDSDQKENENNRKHAKEQEGIQTLMLVCLVVLSIFVFVACASLSVRRFLKNQDKAAARCCFKKKKFPATDSIRSVSMYPLLYDNPLARRPLPKEPHFVSYNRARPSEDVRWTNGGVYGIGSNRSSFISLSSSQNNLNSSTQIIPNVPPSRQGMLLPVPPTQTVLPPPISCDQQSLYSYGENVPLVPSSRSNRGKNRAVRQTSALEEIPGSQVRFPAENYSARPRSVRRNAEEERRRRRKRRTSRRPESAIIIPTLPEQDENRLSMIRDKSLLLRSRSSTKELGTRRSGRNRSHRNSNRQRRNRDEIIEVRKELLLLKKSNELNISSKTTTNEMDTDQSLDRALPSLGVIPSEHYDQTSSSESLERERKSRRLPKFKKDPETDAEKDQSSSSESSSIECKGELSSSFICLNSIFQNEEEEPPQSSEINEDCHIQSGVYNKLDFDPKNHCNSSESDYDILSLCTEKENLQNGLQQATLEELRDEESENISSIDNPFHIRKKSVDSMYVDKESNCESISTMDDSSCFSSSSDYFEMLHPLIDSWDPYNGLFGSDQCILDSLRDQGVIVERRVQTSPPALEQYTVPLSELSSEEEMSILKLQTIRSRSSSIGSSSTIIENRNKKKQEEFIYSLAEESPVFDSPKLICDESKGLNNMDSPRRITDFKCKSNEAYGNYQHIKDMYSGFKGQRKIQDVGGSKENLIFNNKETRENMKRDSPPMKLRKKEKIYPTLNPEENKKERNGERPVVNEMNKNKKNKREKQNQRMTKNEGYFEAIDDQSSSDDDASTDVELFDLGTL